MKFSNRNVNALPYGAIVIINGFVCCKYKPCTIDGSAHFKVCGVSTGTCTSFAVPIGSTVLALVDETKGNCSINIEEIDYD